MWDGRDVVDVRVHPAELHRSCVRSGRKTPLSPALFVRSVTLHTGLCCEHCGHNRKALSASPPSAAQIRHLYGIGPPGGHKDVSGYAGGYVSFTVLRYPK